MSNQHIMFSRIGGEGGRVVGEGGVGRVVCGGGELFIAGEQVGQVTAERACGKHSQTVRMSHR